MGVLLVLAIHGMSLRPIVPAINAICFLDFTSEKWRKSANYPRFFGKLNAGSMKLEKTDVFDYYPRIQGPDRATGASPNLGYHRRDPNCRSRKVYLILRLAIVLP